MPRTLQLLILATLLLSGVVASRAAVPSSGSPATAEGPKAVPEHLSRQPLDVKLRRLEKGHQHLSELRGKPVLLKLWATWCIPCRAQEKVLDILHEELASRGVQVIAVDEGEKPEVVRHFLAQTPSPFAVLLDPNQELASRLDVGALPFLALLRSDGSVAALHQGLVGRDGVLEMLARLPSAGAKTSS